MTISQINVRRYALRVTPLLLFSITTALCIYFIYMTKLFTPRGPKREIESSFHGTHYDVEISLDSVAQQQVPMKSGVRRVKISVPYHSAPKGCDTIYGAAVYQFTQHHDQMNRQLFIENPRILIKFTYDPRNLRCESKDLEFDPKDLPESIKVQIIDVGIESSRITETPRPIGLQIVPVITPVAISSEILETAIPPSTPFLPARHTSRNTTFSFQHKPGEIEILINPRDDIRAFLLNEFSRRTERCRTTKVCGKIHIAVAGITDPELIEAMNAASYAGIAVEAITNWQAYAGRFMPLGGTFSNTPDRAPWFWVKGAPSKMLPTQRLPMHTKFAIFDDDLVVSSNGNWNFDFTYRSREVATVYRGKKAAAIFEEIFGIIRTSSLYPLSVNLQDSVVILLNTDRRPGYSAILGKPKLEFETEEGVSATAYGILFELFARSQEKLSLFMSPLTNHCATYRRDRCLFNLLTERAEKNNIRVLLNSFYYFPASLQLSLGEMSIDEAKKELLAESSKTKEAFGDLSKALASAPNSLELYASPRRKWSNHHQRLAIMGDSTTIVGSANYAQARTLNTIELIRDKGLTQQMKSEVATYDEPYFITAESAYANAEYTSNGCEFMVERDLLHSRNFERKEYNGAAIRTQAIQGLHIDPASELDLLVPDFGSAATNSSDITRIPTLSRTPLLENLRALSSYFCVVERHSGQSFIVFQPPEQVSR